LKPVLEFLEVMIIRTCNLSCQGCTTFSDLTYNGYTTWEQGKLWLKPWIQRLDIQAIGLMGGEPLINPQIKLWIQGIRALLPNAQIRFVTNGLLLERHWEVVELLNELGNTVLKISDHIKDPRIQSVIDRVFNTYTWQPVTEYGINRWATDRENRFQIARPERFMRTFQFEYANMAPHDSNPTDAFAVCVQKRCPLLYNGELYKCGTIGLTPELLERNHWPNQELWQPYISQGLLPDCSDNTLAKFINNYGKPHAICRQCPTANDVDSWLDHRSTVVLK
jgi:organic radical activating enzyme